MPNVVVFRRGPWTQAEMADLHDLTVAALGTGLRVAPSTGETDEGDPWYALVAPNDRVVLHVCRVVYGYAAFGEAIDPAHYRKLSDIGRKVFAGSWRNAASVVIGAGLAAGLAAAGCLIRLTPAFGDLPLIS
jgi:hypothetical protein